MVVYPVNRDGSAGDSIQFLIYRGSSIDSSRQEAPHIHSVMVSPDNRYVYVADLGTDRVMIYSIDHKTGLLSPASTPWASSAPGAGPRHFTFHPTGPFVYVAEELGSTTGVYRRDIQTGRLDEIQRISTLPDDFELHNSVADIHPDPQGRHLYVSNRGHNSLVIYSIDRLDGTLELEGFEPVRGDHPRNFMMGPRGEYVMVANRNTDNVVVFKRNPSDGSLSLTGITLQVPAPVCLKLHRLL
jgi:6-phosphogluconolactonase